MKITYRVFYPNGIFGDLVARYTDSDASHLSLVIEDDMREWESVYPNGVVNHLPGHWEEGITGDSYTVEAEPEKVGELREFLKSVDGLGYGTSKIAHMLFPWLRVRKNQYICSELAYKSMCKLGIGFPYPDPVFNPDEVEVMLLQLAHDRPDVCRKNVK